MSLKEFLYPDLKKIVIAKVFIIPMLFLEAMGFAFLDLQVVLAAAAAVYLIACAVTYNNEAEEI